MNSNRQKCPECERQNVFATISNSGAGYGPMFLPGLGGFLRMAKFEVLVCADCGLTRFYAEPDARTKLSGAKGWSRI
jgi:predicted nucleic-acid-binding Zn-ribbon protein